MKSLLIGIKNVILWSYERGTWQYDVLCLLIIAVIFLVPSSFFGDRDRISPLQANYSLKSTSNNNYGYADLIDIAVLKQFLKEQNKSELIEHPENAARLLIEYRLKQEINDIKVESFTDEHGRQCWWVRYSTNP